MTVLLCEEDYTRRRATRKLEKHVREYKLAYALKCDTNTETVANILTATGLDWGSACPGDGDAFCTNVDISWQEGGIVEVEFSFSNDVKADNPLDEPAEISWDYTEQEVPLEVDASSGTKVITTNGLPYDPTYMVAKHYPTLTVKKNLATFNPSTAYAYSNAVNSDTFYGAVAGTLKCKITAQSVNDPEIGTYYAVQFTFQYNPNKWSPVKIINRSFMVKDSTGKLVEAKDDVGNPVSEPAYLTSTGTKLATGGTVTTTDWNAYTSLSFSSLGV